MRAGEIKGDELTVRCHFCGDSQSKPWQGHLQINLKSGLYHCYRCGESGKVPYSVFFQLINHYGVGNSEYLNEGWGESHFEEPISNFDMIDEGLLTGPGNSRFSMLDRYHVEFQGKFWDVFEMRNPKTTDVVGFNLRRENEKGSHGHLGLGWVGEDFPLSSQEAPLYIVEGGYDVIRADHVAVFGFINASPLSNLMGHSVVLVPDGDVWQKPNLRSQFINTMRLMLQSRRWKGASLLGVDILLEGRDPDEVKPEDRIKVRGKRELVQLMSDLNAGCYTNQRLTQLRSNIDELSSGF